MRRIVKFFMYYLIFAFPSVIAILSTRIYAVGSFAANHSTLWEIISLTFISWSAVLLLFLISLVISPYVQEHTLKHLANIKENDEREEYITGKAARASYISTLSVMIFFLFFSVFSFKLVKLAQAYNGHHYELGMTMGYEMFNKVEPVKVSNDTVLFDSKELVPSSASIIFILLCWQLIAFNISARKEQD